MKYSVVIPSKTVSNLVPCVEAVRKYEPGVDIIWIDDRHKKFERSTEDEEHAVVLRAAGLPFITTIEGASPFVFARNVNLGIRAALGQPIFDGVVLLNDDALLQTPNGFTKLAQFAADHPEVGCVAPATNITGQPLQWSCNRTQQGYRYVDTLPYICVYIPRTTFERVGLLDERYDRDYGVEDLDHVTAMQRAGLKVAILYDVFVDHGSLRSSFRDDPKQPKSFAKNYALFKAKWGR